MWQDKTDRSERIETGQILSLDRRSGPGRQLSVLMALEAYWRGLGRDGHVPNHREVEPRNIGHCLRHCYMSTIVSPGLARIRFAGQELEQIFGMELRGMPMSALFDPGSRVRLHDALTRATAVPAIVELPLEAPQGLLRRGTPGRMSLLPLHDEVGQVTRILGAAVFDSRAVIRSPTQLSIPKDGAYRVETLDLGLSRRAGPGKAQLRLVVDNG